MKTLVQGYGNDSRCDDGVGAFVIDQLRALDLPGVDLRSSHQLQVEMAEALAGYDRVIFVDAATPDAPEPIQRTLVAPCLQNRAVSHYVTPAEILLLCRMLYGSEPQAILFSIRGRNFDFGTTLTPEVESAAREVARQITATLVSATREAGNAEVAPETQALGSQKCHR